MFERIVVLDRSEGAEQAIPIVRGAKVSEQDVADAARYLAALQAAYVKRQEQSQADSTDTLQEAARYCQLNFFC